MAQVWHGARFLWSLCFVERLPLRTHPIDTPNCIIYVAAFRSHAFSTVRNLSFSFVAAFFYGHIV